MGRDMVQPVIPLRARARILRDTSFSERIPIQVSELDLTQTHGTAIGLLIRPGVVPGGQLIGIYGSPMECLGYVTLTFAFALLNEVLRTC